MIFVAATHTARSGARTGIQTVVRGVLRRNDLLPVIWNSRRRILHPPRNEWRANLDLPPGPERLPLQTLCAPSNWLAWIASRGWENRVPLHRHPQYRRQLAGSWLLMPELMEGDVIEETVTYARRCGMRCAAVFHDAIPVLRPDLTERTAAAHADYMRALAGLDIVISVSDFSATCFRQWLEQNSRSAPRIETCGLPAETFGQTRITRHKAAPGTPVKLLCVCTLEPRKNHRTLLEAFGRLQIPAELHLAGASYAGSPEIAESVRELSRQDPRIQWHGSLKQEQIAALYSECDFTVYPSFLEGFGLPVVESLWNGRPCICANFGVMAESAAEGGCLTVDVNDPGELARAIERLATDPALYARLGTQAVSRPLATWESYADRIVSLLSSHPGHA